MSSSIRGRYDHSYNPTPRLGMDSNKTYPVRSAEHACLFKVKTATRFNHYTQGSKMTTDACHTLHAFNSLALTKIRHLDISNRQLACENILLVLLFLCSPHVI